jgi:hypothetical protein
VLSSVVTGLAYYERTVPSRTIGAREFIASLLAES